jgi:dethiobiotin synthetase
MVGLLFTGTDTGVGKTFVVAALARELRRRGETFRVCKPVATGGVPAEDTRILAEAAGDADLGAITPWAFPEPAAPPVAAQLVGVSLSLDEITAAVRRRAVAGGLVLVEGVGGLLCPLTERETVADLAAELRLPLVVVARRALGTINHTLLTVEVAGRRGLPVAGVVVSETAPPRGAAEQTNVDELRKRLDVPLLAVVAHGAADAAELARVDWRRLAGAE